MEAILEDVRKRNPHLAIHSVFDPAFAAFGRVLPDLQTEPLTELLRRTRMPEAGNLYEASDAALEQLAVLSDIRRIVFGGMEIQAGYCNGYGHTLNALEYHKCSEVNFAPDGLVLLLAEPERLVDGRIDAANVSAFYLPGQVAIELYPRVLHFAPCRVRAAGFQCLVVLERGVNVPLEAVDTSARDESRLLWMRGKWLTAHPDSPQAQKGAFAGIQGENIQLL